MEKISLPSKKEVQNIWDQYSTPKHIRRHMQQVNHVAMAVAQQLKASGEDVILDVVDRASLLHDTVRVTDWETLSFEHFPYTPSREEIAAWESQRSTFASTIPHSQVNYEIFKADYPEMAQVILLHSIGRVHELRTWEEKIVHYADRRVAHDRIVTVQERLDEAAERYGKHGESLEHNPEIVTATFQLEKELQYHIAQDINQLVS